MAKRKWINARKSKGMSWWMCPGKGCEGIWWKDSIQINTPEACPKCGVGYLILNTQQNRVLIEEIPNETKS